MNTVKKGDSFEDKTFACIKSALRDGRLGFREEQCRPFQKKGYYSRDRDCEIIVDISIELWLPDAETWSLLWVCECKDYSGSIPVNDVEEFKAKLDQIAGKNVKGVMAMTSALQHGAFAYAKANGIGVVRVLPDDQITWASYWNPTTSSLNSITYAQALTILHFNAENQSFFGACDGYLFECWRDLLRMSLRL